MGLKPVGSWARCVVDGGVAPAEAESRHAPRASEMHRGLRVRRLQASVRPDGFETGWQLASGTLRCV